MNKSNEIAGEKTAALDMVRRIQAGEFHKVDRIAQTTQVARRLGFSGVKTLRRLKALEVDGKIVSKDQGGVFGWELVAAPTAAPTNVSGALFRLARVAAGSTEGAERAARILEEIAQSIKDGVRHQAPGYWSPTEVATFNVLHEALNPTKGTCDGCGGTFIDPTMRGLCSECE